MSTHNICFHGEKRNYRIQPNYRTVRLGFFKITGNTHLWENMYLPTKDTL